jgi:hypothetical protein
MIMARSDSVDVKEPNASGKSAKVKPVITEDPVVSAMQTRAQEKAETKFIRALKQAVVDALNLSPAKISKFQKDYNTLTKYWKLAESHSENDGYSL